MSKICWAILVFCVCAASPARGGDLAFAPRDLDFPLIPLSGTTADIDGDGDLDIFEGTALTLSLFSFLAWYENDGAKIPNFTRHIIVDGSGVGIIFNSVQVADMDGDNFPLEVRLEDAVSFDKGCYMGQETLAHIKNLGHLNRRLVGLKVEGETNVGAEVLAPGGSVGKLTSVIRSPRLGTTLALAMMKDKAAAPGADLTVTGGHRVTLVEFPL